MKYSEQNILSKVKDSENHFIVNLLTGNADILDPQEAEKLKLIRNGGEADPEFMSEMEEKGYIADSTTEKRLFRAKYYNALDDREHEEVQLFFILNYSCNFGCTYCYQDEYTNSGSVQGFALTDAFFQYLLKEFAIRKKYITVFGGEPLLNTRHQKEQIAYLLQKANEAQLEVCFVTNGYTLEEYIDTLKTGKIREIQITIDGTASVHDNRRTLKGGGKTFEKIVKGVDACLDNGLAVNLRMVIDKENIDNLPEFTQFAIDKGWTSHPLFKTQIGRNYELHHCQAAPDKLFSRISLYEKLFDLIRQYPHIQEFYKPAYSISKYLSENGKLPDPLFDACPACKTEWAFDYTGKIYSCTATVGKADEALGTFYPVISRNNELINQWEKRDVTTISECKTCSVQLACGGGCGSVAKNKNGTISSPDCRPVKELHELGFASYFK
ncbi:MAG: radical SAM protein [Bacteroidia bacterium]|nr:radical SAM protein [Bacteroidia bacterium]